MDIDLVPANFLEFQEMLYDIALTKHNRFRSNFVFRGVGDKCWGLETSLQRMGSHAASIERPLLRNFLKYAGPGEIASDALLYRLALAQHHGLPTRVLDWTTAPKVAAHFALSNENHFGVDGAIWCIDVASARRVLPPTIHTILAAEDAFVFSVEMLEKYKTLASFDEIDPKNDFVLFFEPPSLDGRIINQGAVLSLMPGPELDLKNYILRPENKDLVKRIIIPAAIKWELRDKLDQDNVSERMLFPGLDGTARFLTRYYSMGPNQTAGKVVPVNPMT
ncbi:FRG domain-containing protein [Rhizobium laguerreae]|uniref:FRG domain-containing protein n=1 Tax=Rhizobium laguerreae TaxID=1076926 RepID=A0AB35FPQ8_9HYPH|nr:FRG domain-containing protein [Rhizobium laguerreae]MBY3068295.1 FRG domain-containing protein [Rhizobium laguerreae]